MRCLVTADLHYALKQWDWLQATAAQYDLVILAGDLLDLAAIADREAQIVVVQKYLARLRPTTRVLVSSGNHDFDDANPAQERVARWLQEARGDLVAVDGDSLEFGSWRFTLCPWWDGPESRAAVGELLRQDAALAPAHWAWIYHAPPQETRVSWTGKGHFGDPHLGHWIQEHQPSLVLGGHVHQAPFRPPGAWADRVGRTWVFNAGRQLGPEPAFLVLDLARGTAEWHSQAGHEHLDLGSLERQPRATRGPAAETRNPRFTPSATAAGGAPDSPTLRPPCPDGPSAPQTGTSDPPGIA